MLKRFIAFLTPSAQKRAGLEAYELYPESEREIKWVGIDKVWYYGIGEDTTEYKRKHIMVATAHRDDFNDGEVKVPIVRRSPEQRQEDP